MEAKPSWAGGGYRVSLTPINDPDTENFKVRLAGNRDLTTHVVRTPDNTNASGVTVQFFTNLGSVNGSGGNASAVTDASGTVGVTLWGGWEPGTATVRARVTANNTNYDDVALIPIVVPNEEETFVGSQAQGDPSNQTNFFAKLSPPESDVVFEWLYVAENNVGGMNWCE